ncbi:RES family NAD+ phosphorylase [Compostibacter hankyongensis]|uniref:RES family NAD+ phosphorylase n=1 Tax=Compostibacter hankyongensis TaxID=1007089 RepID=A0ABP8FXZ5_9BACT
MEVYRIAQCRYIRDMSGAGAQLYGGRWNSKGLPVVYTGGNRSLCALEALVHIPQKNMTADFCMAVIEIPENCSVGMVAGKTLPKDWQSSLFPAALRQIGDSWCREGQYAVLQVPSALVPEEWNYLINPLHPDAGKITLKAVQPFMFDKRLLK